VSWRRSAAPSAEIDPTLPIYDVQLVNERVAEAVARPRFTAIVTAIFAVSAAALAAMGVFGVMAYTVSLRREELAVRLGARRHAARAAPSRARQAARLAAIGSSPASSSACGCCDRSAACCTASRRAIPSRCHRGGGDGNSGAARRARSRLAGEHDGPDGSAAATVSSRFTVHGFAVDGSRFAACPAEALAKACSRLAPP
jgi:hypothetical protein